MIPEIDIETFAEQLAAGATTIDVRETDEYVEAHVPGVHLFPLSDFSNRLSDLPVGPLLIICRSGGRSRNACEMLAASGRPEATNVVGGTTAWIISGREIVSGPERG